MGTSRKDQQRKLSTWVSNEFADDAESAAQAIGVSLAKLIRTALASELGRSPRRMSSMPVSTAVARLIKARQQLLEVNDSLQCPIITDVIEQLAAAARLLSRSVHEEADA